MFENWLVEHLQEQVREAQQAAAEIVYRQSIGLGDGRSVPDWVSYSTAQHIENNRRWFNQLIAEARKELG